MAIPAQRIVFFLYVLSAAFAVTAFCILPWWTVDDAFISYRYGQNLLHNGELTWNVGEAHVEGYTGIFLPLLACGLQWIGLPVVASIKHLGIVTLFLTLGLTYQMLNRLEVGAIRCATVILLLAASPLLYLHSISGLETIFFMCSLSAVFAGLIRSTREPSTSNSALTGLAIGFGGFCRPEGMALAVLVLIYVLLYIRQSNRLINIYLLSLSLLLGLFPILIYWVWRYHYYGSWMPNSYYTKAYEGIINIDSVLAFGKFLGYYLALPFVAAVLVGGWAPSDRWRENKSWLLVALSFVGCCILTYFHSHLWMNFGSRFFVPFLPIILVGLATWSSANSTFTSSPSIPNWKRMALIGLLVAQLGVMGFRFKQEWTFLNYYNSIVQEELIPIGRQLRQSLQPGSRVISFMDAGAVGYYSELPIVDFGRLNDPYLARMLHSQTEINDYFFSQNAAAVVMTSESPDTVNYVPEAMAIVRDPRFQQYHRVMVLGNAVGYPYWQFVFFHRAADSEMQSP